MPPQEGFSERMQAAFDLHRSGDFARAEPIYRDLLVEMPKDFNLLHLLGLVCFQTERFEEADQLMAQALRENPRSADAESNHGLVLLRLNRPEEAIKRFKSALRHDPKSQPAMANHAAGLIAAGRLEEALQWTERHIKMYPKSIEMVSSRGDVLKSMGRYPAAIEDFEHVLAMDPERVSALVSLAVCHAAVGNVAEAARWVERALRIEPGNREALALRGEPTVDAADLDEALLQAEKASKAEPQSIALHLKRSHLLGRLERYQEALAACDLALGIQSDHAEALFYKGIAHEALFNFEAALSSYQQILARDPAHAAAHWNEAYCQLMLGQLADGFRNYEWRWKTPFLNKKLRFNQPLWIGQTSIKGKRILLHSEQGFGDTFQFLRYVKQVEELGAFVLLEVPKAVVALVEPLFRTQQVFETDAALPEFDVQCPLPSLPLAMGTTESSLPGEVPYLHADPERVNHWRALLGEPRGLRIGVVWSGNPSHVNDANRSIALAQFLDAFPSDVELIALQKEFRATDQVALRRSSAPLNLADQLESFADTAAVIELCDLVVSIDTGVAHLAGALNKPTWILADAVSDWRWQRDRTDSPWYPSVKLYRQATRHQWSPVLARVKADLKAMLPRRGLLSMFAR